MADRTFSTQIRVVPTVATTIYTANDVLGTLMEFALAGRGGNAMLNGSGIVQSAIMVDHDSEDVATELYLFNAEPSAQSDLDPFTPTDADLAKMCGGFDFNVWKTFASNSISIGSPMRGGSPVFDLGAATSLWGWLRTLGTPTYTAATDVEIILGILQD